MKKQFCISPWNLFRWKCQVRAGIVFIFTPPHRALDRRRTWDQPALTAGSSVTRAHASDSFATSTIPTPQGPLRSRTSPKMISIPSSIRRFQQVACSCITFLSAVKCCKGPPWRDKIVQESILFCVHPKVPDYYKYDKSFYRKYGSKQWKAFTLCPVLILVI
jgi:hypothetical protein